MDDAFNLERREDEGDKVMFVHSPVDSDGRVKKRDEPYDPNGKVVMDNHPLMIMAELRKGVRVVKQQIKRDIVAYLSNIQLCHFVK